MTEVEDNKGQHLIIFSEENITENKTYNVGSYEKLIFAGCNFTNAILVIEGNPESVTFKGCSFRNSGVNYVNMPKEINITECFIDNSIIDGGSIQDISGDMQELIADESVDFEQIVIGDDWKDDYYSIVRTIREDDSDNETAYFFDNEEEMWSFVKMDDNNKCYILDGDVKYYLQNSSDDEPAIETVDGTIAHFLKGYPHRNFAPAIYNNERGTEEWFVYGHKHRTDGPAEKYANGKVYWALGGKILSKSLFDQCLADYDIIHSSISLSFFKKNTSIYDSDIFPSFISEHARQWFKDNTVHRIDGPALQNADGEEEYWFKGEKLSGKEELYKHQIEFTSEILKNTANILRKNMSNTIGSKKESEPYQQELKFETQRTDGTIGFNENDNKVDFRINSEIGSDLFFIDAGHSNIGMATSAPNAQLNIGSSAGIGIAGTNSADLFKSVDVGSIWNSGNIQTGTIGSGKIDTTVSITPTVPITYIPIEFTLEPDNVLLKHRSAGATTMAAEAGLGLKYKEGKDLADNDLSINIADTPEDKEDNGKGDWFAPVMAIAAAGILGIFASKNNKKEVEKERTKVEVKEEVLG